MCALEYFITPLLILKNTKNDKRDSKQNNVSSLIYLTIFSFDLFHCKMCVTSESIATVV